jgi:hypothetical protein
MIEPMKPVYEAIGRLVVTFVRIRFRRQLRIAAVVGVAALVGAGYVLATRDVEEG